METFWKKAPKNVETRWASFENPLALKGKGGMENKGGKGHAFDFIEPGETKTLLNVSGSGTVRRMWLTIGLGPKTAKNLRSLRLDMTWDDSDKPAVSVPFGDFFCWIMGSFPPGFDNALFASPEGRSFVCYVPMPFRKGAKITLTNESDERVTHVFYDIEITIGEQHADDVLYFHAHWRRERWTTLCQDFEILPRVQGSGRFIGSHVGVITHPENRGWWGEGEIKMYLDGDSEWPSLVGTGTEDYISTAWSQGVYAHRYHGCTRCDNEKKRYGFYRYHIPDPVVFHSDCRVTMQQIGGTMKNEVMDLLKEGKEIKPVSLDQSGVLTKLLEQTPEPSLESIPDGWVNFYRRDDWSAVAFFYLDAPTNNLPDLAQVAERLEDIE